MIAAISPTQSQTSPLSDQQQQIQVGPDENEEYNSFFDYNQARLRIDNLIKQWTDEIAFTKTRRNMRNIDVDLLQLYKEGKLKADETFIPIRVIDSTIKREQPSFISFLTQSRRLAIFSCIDDPSLDTNLIEAAFTRGMMYSGWQLPLYKCVDGAQTHGWDSIEIEYREDRPLHVNIDHVGHENLLFARDARDLEACEILLRRYELSVMQIKRFVKEFGWDYAEAYKTYALQDTNKDYKNVVIYKGMFKWQGQIYVFWTGTTECADWIKAPMPLSLGREKTETYTEIVDVPQTIPHPTDPTLGPITFNLPTPQQKQRQVPVYETQYPYKLLAYCETEQQAITDYKGRCFYDGPKQEAQTALWSVLVNGSVRASNVYGSPKNADNTGQPLKKLDLDLEHGCMYNLPVEFWHTEYPNPAIVKVSDGLETRTQAESGQIAFAVNNREDSRKTATENTLAAQQQSMLSGVSVTLFSVFLQKVFSHAWLICQSVALLNKIAFLQIDTTESNQLGMPPETIKVNDTITIAKKYDIRSAGDVDVVQRADKLNRRQTLWPIIAQTPLAMTFLGDMLKEAFPEDADRYLKVIEQQNQQQQMIANMGNVIQHMALDDTGKVKPEFSQYAPQLMQLKQQVMQSQTPTK